MTLKFLVVIHILNNSYSFSHLFLIFQVEDCVAEFASSMILFGISTRSHYYFVNFAEQNYSK